MNDCVNNIIYYLYLFILNVRSIIFIDLTINVTYFIYVCVYLIINLYIIPRLYLMYYIIAARY